MYRILLDSSNRDLAVGLAKDNILIDKIRYEAWQRQSETMVDEINTILERNSVTRDEIDGIIVSIGPGSYTGVRIGLTIAKVMALALNCPIYKISSLAILKCEEKPSICVINARSNRSYIGVYKGKETVIKDTIWTNEEVKKYILEHSYFIICGDAKYLGYEGFSSDIISEMLSLADSSSICEDNLGLTPVYLKD